MAPGSVPSLVAIDLDGVLADTFDIHVAGWKLIMAELGCLPDAQVVSDLRGVPTRTALGILCRRLGVKCSPGLLAQLETIKNEVRDEAVDRLTPADVLPGARGLLAECHRARTTAVCVATSTAAPRVIKNLGLVELLDDIRYGKMVRPSKADSSAYIQALLAEYSVSARLALVLDDGRAIVARCLEAGIPAVVIGEKGTKAEHPHGRLGEGIGLLYQRGKIAAGLPP